MIQIDSMNFKRSIIIENNCRTPAREIGKCVPIRECSIHMHLLKESPRPFPESRKKYIMDSYCDIKKKAVSS